MGLACARRMLDLVDVVLLVDRDAAAVTAAAPTGSCGIWRQGRAGGGGRDRRSRAPAWPSAARSWARCGRWHMPPACRPPWPTGAPCSPSTSWARPGWPRRCVPWRRPAPPWCASPPWPRCSASASGTPRRTALDEPLDERLLDRPARGPGPRGGGPGHGLRLGQAGSPALRAGRGRAPGPGRGPACSVSPGVIDTEMGRQERESHPFMDVLVERTPLGRRPARGAGRGGGLPTVRRGELPQRHRPAGGRRRLRRPR